MGDRSFKILSYSGDFTRSTIGDPAKAVSRPNSGSSSECTSRTSPVPYSSVYPDFAVFQKKIQFTEDGIGYPNAPANSAQKTPEKLASDVSGEGSPGKRLRICFKSPEKPGFNQAAPSQSDDDDADRDLDGLLELQSTPLKFDQKNYYSRVMSAVKTDFIGPIQAANTTTVTTGQKLAVFRQFIDNSTQKDPAIRPSYSDHFVDQHERALTQSMDFIDRQAVQESISRAKNEILNLDLIADEIGRQYLEDPKLVFQLLTAIQTDNTQAIKEQVLKFRKAARNRVGLADDGLTMDNHLEDKNARDGRVVDGFFKKFRELYKTQGDDALDPSTSTSTTSVVFIHPQCRQEMEKYEQSSLGRRLTREEKQSFSRHWTALHLPGSARADNEKRHVIKPFFDKYSQLLSFEQEIDT